MYEKRTDRFEMRIPENLKRMATEKAHKNDMGLSRYVIGLMRNDLKEELKPEPIYYDSVDDMY